MVMSSGIASARLGLLESLLACVIPRLVVDSPSRHVARPVDLVYGVTVVLVGYATAVISVSGEPHLQGMLAHEDALLHRLASPGQHTGLPLPGPF
jgi:hypothetical protein